MKTLSCCSAALILAGGLLVNPVIQADSLPLQSVNKANEVIDAALEAHGGAEALSNLHSLVQKSEMDTFRTGQSRKPGPPYDKGTLSSLSAIDTEKKLFYNRNKGEGGGYVFSQGTLINGDDSWQLDFRAGIAAPIAEPDYDTQSGPFIRVTPALLMKQLQARRGQSNWLGVAEIDGRKHDLVTLVMSVGPALALYIDQETHMLTRMERVLPPFGQVEYRFQDYQLIDGIPFNMKFLLLVNGEPNLDIDNVKTLVNSPLDDYLDVPEGLEKVAAVQPDELSVNEIADGVFLAGGNATYSLFVEMPDYLVAVGGTQIVADALKALRDEGIEKPVKYGVITHHHSDHVPGAATYAAEGAIVVAPAAHEAVVRQAAGSDEAKFEFVTYHMTIGSGARTVEVYNIGPTPHSEHILMAYVPDTGVIFEADHFPLPQTGIIPPAVPAVEAFAAALEKLDLDYSIIAGTHSPRTAGPEDVKTALQRKPVEE
ncbi:MAG: MBL fold metallo-hydrolase [Xanthomonadales bacterium]|jgi:glyoxylase-like metal-dependent hydrolase (beta-lactamase superfamily II)|nr:MBL fold metallo-hydrolase [Xanthomonadales bacterium]